MIPETPALIEPYPPEELWPKFIYSLPELAYSEQLNACYELLDTHLSNGRGAAPAVYFGSSTLTYNDVYDQVVRMAGALHEKGIGPGDRVLLRLLNRPHFITAWLALLRLGAVAVATSPLIKAREIEAVIDSSRPKLLVTEPDLMEEVHRLRDSRPMAAMVDELTNAHSPTHVPCSSTRPDSLAIIAYTSGSTGVPKGCMHSHRALLASADSYARYVLKPTSDDRFGGHPTMAFTYGLGGLLLFPFRFGASTVLLDRYTPEGLIQTIEQHHVTIVSCAPTTYRILMRQFPDLKQRVQSLRLAVSAGETLSESTYTAWMNTTGVEILDGLGSTEMLHIFISGRAGYTRPGTTGQVVPGYEAMVVDENFEQVPDGTAGLLAVRGPTGCRYLSLPERQKEYVRDGWNIPGDVYVRDSEGFFHYQCRNDDLIICGGYNIAGPEVESVLLQHPAVMEVAVVASPEELHGFVPKAFVVLNNTHVPSEDLKRQLQQFVKEEIAPYKYPRKIDFVTELPKTTTGKIRRGELRRLELQYAQG